MTVRLRPTLTTLPAYVPGRSVPGAIKLASNETSLGPLPHVVRRITEVAGEANRYPDSFATELGSALAARFGVDPTQVVVGCGSVSLCQQLVLATAGEGDEVLFAWRSFEAYPIITTIDGATGVKVPLREDVHDLTAMAEAITDRTRLVFVCNPNNPTGTAVREAELRAFLDRVPPQVVIVLDEAYREYVIDPEVVDATTLLADYPNLIVLRTFSKAYGLAGLRVGYGIAADATLSNAVRQTQVPFAVTQIAQAAALACLEPPAEKELRQRVEDVTVERIRVTDELRAIGYAVPDSQANFVWLGNGPAEQGGIDALAFSTGCEDRGVIVRAFADSGVRVTVGLREENDAFLAAARALRARPVPADHQTDDTPDGF
ncbi:histidinol-phosphate transaminase [Jatrophihabitans telluris]|uniref:Aromatic amino acid aminotransferase n=1 Tax=Jatrophihabitans telluris TaxID=2038343 RepID=A0ABY4QZR2_9ACTN|nr:histidinol-phosphate transaminase [Jatrophihabitans telluris]UQX88587.1 histidinol-phosphate transaminase [Jatrophihabitans telluris]